MNPSARRIVPAALAIPAAVLTISAASAGTPAEPVIETSSPPSGWEFRIEPYGWVPNLNGTLGVRGLTADVDANMIEDNVIDYLDMAAALQFEARNGRWGVIADGLYGKFGVSGSPPGPLYDEVKVAYKQFFGELDIAYRVIEKPNYFVDVYAGFRYTSMSLDLHAKESATDVVTFSGETSARIREGAITRADAIVEPKLDAYKAAAAADRALIEKDVTSAVVSATERRVRRELKRELERIRRDAPGDRARFDIVRLAHKVERQRAELAASTARLKITEMRASVDDSLQNKVDQARARVSRAEGDLAKSINKEITKQLPTSASGDEQWIDPIIGTRAQWNINDKWFLAGKGDIGGFGVSSDLTWSLQATAGYNFTDRVSAELGYRYMYDDYTNGGFTNDLATHGVYMGLNVEF